MYNGQKFTGLELKSLSPHINIVHGANASGKSTLGHVIQSVLLPSYLKKRFGKQSVNPNFDANLQIRAGVLEIRVNGEQRDLKLDGDKYPWSADLIRPDSYHISLHDLLSADTGGREFEQEIMKQASGGVDVFAAEQALGFTQLSKKLTANTNEAKAYTRSRRQLQSIKQKQQGLARERERLHGLNDELSSTKVAEERVVLIKKALAYRKAEEARDRSRHSLMQFSEQVRKCSPGMLENVFNRLEECDKQIQSNEATLDKLGRELSVVNEGITKNNLPPDGLPEGLLERITRAIEKLADIEARMETTQAQIVHHISRENTILLSIGDGTTPAVATELKLQEVQALESIAHRIRRYQSKADALDALENILHVASDEDLEAQTEKLQRGKQVLIEWLKENNNRIRGLARIRTVLWVTAGLAIALSVALVITLNTPIGLLGLLVAGLIGLSLIWLRAPTSDSSRNTELQRQYGKLMLQMPSTWERTEVSDLLDELLSSLGKAQVDTEKQRAWSTRASEKEKLIHEWEKLSDDIRTLHTQAGLNAAAEKGLEFLLNQIKAYRENFEKLSGENAELNLSRKRHSDHLTAINELLSNQGFQPAESLDDCREALIELRSQNDQLLRDIEKQQSLTSQISDITRQQEEAQTRKSRIFTDLGLEIDDTAALYQLVQDREKLDPINQDLQEKETLLQKAQQDLQNSTGFTDDLMSMPEAELNTSLREQQQVANEKDSLIQRIVEIKKDVDDTEASHDLEDAHAEVSQNQAVLEKDRKKHCEQVAGHVLVKNLMAHIRNEGMPEVFTKAHEHFYQATLGRYELRFTPEGAFAAHDTERDLSYSLNELSSGTRVQLLLCVRVAFVETLEKHGDTFPLTLDEALGNSDDDRADTVIRTLAQLAERRQIIYFTAQTDEVNKWRTSAGDTPIEFIKLASVHR